MGFQKRDESDKMNIFVLDENPTIAAEMHCDKHVPKMIVEHTQMLAAAYYSTLGISRKKEIAHKQNLVNKLFQGFPRKKSDGSDWPYAITHVNHPCTVWTRSSIDNWNWLIECTDALCTEFNKRWKHPHSVKAIINWMRQNPPTLPSIGQTQFGVAVPDCFRTGNATESYKKYYATKTSYMKVEWKYSNKPCWFSDKLINESLDTYRQFTEIAA